MANNKSGDVDYFELRRRHQEYKKNATREPEEAETPSSPSPRAEDAPYMRSAPPAQDVRAQDFPEDEPPRKAAYAPSARNEDDDLDEDEADNSGANPFQSFILAFNKLRVKFAARRAQNADGGLDDSDDGYDDEEPKEERRGAFRFLRKREEEPETDEPDEDPEEDDARADDESFAHVHVRQDASPTQDVPDPDDVSDQAFVPTVLDVPEEETLPEGEAIPVPRAKDNETYDEDDEDDAHNAPRGGGFKRFLNLFVVREDLSEGEPIDEDDYEVDEPESRAVPGGKNKEYDDSLFTKPREHGASEEDQEPMGEQENNKTNLTDLMADGLDDGTLSRRERRLLKERQEALKQAAEPEASGGANIDEPTREYKPVARPQAQPEARPEHVSSLFGDEEGFHRKNAKRDDYDDEGDDEPKSRKRAKRDDYDDEDEDEPKSRRHAKRDDYDYDDEDDEPKSRRRAKRDDYDDEDEDEPKSRKRAKRDDYDDEDDEPKFRKRAKRDDYDDEDDDYEARRGRGYDSYADDDDDYDDDAPSFGHYVLGFFKVLIAIILVLAVALFGLYFADQAVPGGVGAYDWLQKKVPVIDKILPPGTDDADTDDADNALNLGTTSPDESPAPDATDAGTVG